MQQLGIDCDAKVKICSNLCNSENRKIQRKATFKPLQTTNYDQISLSSYLGIELGTRVPNASVFAVFLSY